MYCRSCGTPIPDDSRFCPVCATECVALPPGSASPPRAAPPARPGPRTGLILAFCGVGVLVIAGTVVLLWLLLGRKPDEPRRVKLDPVSRRLVQKLTGRMQARLFVSRKLPAELGEALGHIKGLLRSYAAHSGGRFGWEVIDPGGSEAAKKRAETYRIVPFNVQHRTSAEVTTHQVTFGLALTYRSGGREEVEVIPVIGKVKPPELEYLLTERIHRLVRGRRKVALITGHQEIPAHQERQMTVALQQLLGAYEVLPHDISKAAPIPPRTAVALVVPPGTPWSQAERQRLDQAIGQGTGVLFLVEGMAVQQQRRFRMARLPQTMMPAKSGLNELLSGWGIQVEGNYVLDEGQQPLLIGQGARSQVISHPAVLSIKAPRAGGAPVALVLASSLKLQQELIGPKIKAGRTFRIAPLLVTSPKSWTVTGPYVFNAQRRDRPPAGASRGARVVGALAEGRLPSAGGGGKPAASRRRTRLVVIGDFDLLRLANHVPGNRLLLQNLVDWIAADESLVTLRNRLSAR